MSNNNGILGYIKKQIFLFSLLLYIIVYAYLKCVSWLCPTLYCHVPVPTEYSISLLSVSFNRNLTVRNIYLIVNMFDQVLLWIVT